MNRMARNVLAQMKVSSTAKTTMEMHAHWRRRKIPMAVEIPQPLKPADRAAITMPIAARGNGGLAGPVAGGGAFSVPNSIAPPIARVARLPAMARTALARMAIHFLCMVAD